MGHDVHVVEQGVVDQECARVGDLLTTVRQLHADRGVGVANVVEHEADGGDTEARSIVEQPDRDGVTDRRSDLELLLFVGEVEHTPTQREPEPSTGPQRGLSSDPSRAAVAATSASPVSRVVSSASVTPSQRRASGSVIGARAVSTPLDVRV